MEYVQGTGVFAGVVVGPLRVREKVRLHIPDTPPESGETELARFNLARAEAGNRLDALHAEAVARVGEDEAAIFEVHRLMLDDLDFTESVAGLIGEGRNAEQAVAATVDNLAAMFAAMEDAYMQARAADVRDAGHRVLALLLGVDDETAMEPGILAADDLPPSETVRLNMDTVLGIATSHGSATSHTAILARTRGIPAVIGLGRAFTGADNGRMAVLDGGTGRLVLDPDEATLAEAETRQAEQARRAARLESLRGKPNATQSGRTVDIFANIGRVEEVAAALANDAGGIGLFRSEFLYLERDSLPSEETLFGAYRAVVQGMGGRKVVFRTLDIGADKQVAYLNLPHEENPALGCRGVRLCLARPDLFRTQLRALYRASSYGPMAIMVPMIISTAEVQAVREVTESVRAELLAEGLPVADTVELGIMIETPAAAVISDELARLVDFFSIGTNDLTQYVLAMDRQNHALESLHDPHHPAVLRLVEQVARNAIAAGIWVGICGELAADTSLTETFLDMGIHELSVSPPMVLAVREKVLSCM